MYKIVLQLQLKVQKVERVCCREEEANRCQNLTSKMKIN